MQRSRVASIESHVEICPHEDKLFEKVKKTDIREILGQVQTHCSFERELLKGVLYRFGKYPTITSSLKTGTDNLSFTRASMEELNYDDSHSKISFHNSSKIANLDIQHIQDI